ncbi:S-adenosyl-L-methionine-dependent methyltransferase [Apiospora arundinis]
MNPTLDFILNGQEKSAPMEPSPKRTESREPGEVSDASPAQTLLPHDPQEPSPTNPANTAPHQEKPSTNAHGDEKEAVPKDDTVSETIEPSGSSSLSQAVHESTAAQSEWIGTPEASNQPPTEQTFEHEASQEPETSGASPSAINYGTSHAVYYPQSVAEPDDFDVDGDGAPSFVAASFGFSVDTDLDESDADSALGDVSRPSSTASVASSIFEFVEENGRTYHRYKEGKYWMPNDAEEQSRLDLQHQICTKLFKGRLALAPIENPIRVLDMGTGTGIWAIEFALQHPNSDVLGTDISPIQPGYVPPNCRFEVDDLEDEWIWSYKFDYIHARHMVGSISDFARIFQTIYENLNPGGYVEFQDYYVKLDSFDGTLDGTALQRWNNMINEALIPTGRSGLNSANYARWMQEAGFEDVVEEKFAVPGNPWTRDKTHKQLGVLQRTNILEGLHGISISLFTKFLGMSTEEVEVFLADVRRDINDTRIHFHYPVRVVYGRKPL